MRQSGITKNDITRLAILTGVALCIGIYLIAATVLISKDGVFYIEQAQRFAENPVGVIKNHIFGYPILIFAAHKLVSLFTDSSSIYAWIYSAQGITLLCRLLAIIPLYFIGRILAGSKNSFFALLILIVLPNLARMGSEVVREWPYILFLSAGFLFLLWGCISGKWWTFGIVGLIAGLGYLIRPICAQLVLYALTWLILSIFLSNRNIRGVRLAAAILTLLIGFSISAVPYIKVKGRINPYDETHVKNNSAPVITAIGDKLISRSDLSFLVDKNESLTLDVKAYDRDGDKLTFSAAFIPPRTKPVYRFRYKTGKGYFWTISEDEKSKLDQMPKIWDYDGIAFYAFEKAGEQRGVKGVHRFWSPANKRHFYTISNDEKAAISDAFSADVWKYEGITFYAYPEGSQPTDAKPIQRFWSQEDKIHFWTISQPAHSNDIDAESSWQRESISWYAYDKLDFPAGAVFADRSLKFKPENGQQSNYRVIFKVSDGELEDCKTVDIKVGHDLSDKPKALQTGSLIAIGQVAGLKAVKALEELAKAIGENLMWFLVPVLGIGIYHHFRKESSFEKKFLITIFIVINLLMPVMRYLFISPDTSRRYTIALICLTIFYIPVGLQIIAEWLEDLFGVKGQSAGGKKHTFWVLLILSICVCLPKLFRPLRPEKRSYIAASQWLMKNTSSDDVIALPDRRIGFYAGRKSVVCGIDNIARNASYVIVIKEDGTKPELPYQNLQEVYQSTNSGSHKVFIYKVM